MQDIIESLRRSISDVADELQSGRPLDLTELADACTEIDGCLRMTVAAARESGDADAERELVYDVDPELRRVMVRSLRCLSERAAVDLSSTLGGAR